MKSVAVLHHLMGSADQVQIVLVKKRLDYISTVKVRYASLNILFPSFAFGWI